MQCKEAIEVLIKHKANIEAHDKDGRKVSDYAKLNDSEKITQLLYKDKKTRLPPASAASKTSLLPSIFKLQTNKKKISSKDYKRLNPVIDDKKHLDVLQNNEQLIKVGAARDTTAIPFYTEKDVNIEACDKYDQISLIHPTYMGDKIAIELLLEHNANIEVRDNTDKTALNYSKENKNNEIIQMLPSGTGKKTSQPEFSVTSEPNLSFSSYKINNTSNIDAFASVEEQSTTLQLLSYPQSTATLQNPPNDTVISTKKLDAEKKILELSIDIDMMGRRLDEHQRILQNYKWIERFKGVVDAENFIQIAKSTLPLVSATVDISKILQKLNDLDKQIRPLNLKQQKKEERLKKIQYILNNDNLRDYYIYFKTLFAITYIGCGAISSGMVVSESSKYAKISNLLGEIVSHLPIVGIAGTVITKISGIVDKRYNLSYANKILAIFSSNKEMERISDLLAIKMANAKYQEICALNKLPNQTRLIRYKDKVQNWLNGNSEKSLAEKMAEKDLTTIMETIASEKMPLTKRTKAEITEHAEEISNSVMEIMEIRENGNNLSEIQINNIETEKDSFIISSASVASYILSSSRSSNSSLLTVKSTNAEEISRKHDEEIAQLKTHIDQLKSSHKSLEADHERFIRLEQEAAKIRIIENELKKKADKDDIEMYSASGNMSQLMVSKGIASRTGNHLSQSDYIFQLDSRMGYMEQHLSGVSDHVAYKHVTTKKTNEEPSNKAIKAFGLKNRPSTKVVKPIAIKTGFDIQEDARTIAENAVDRLLECARSNSPNPNLLPKRFANKDVKKDLIKYLSENILSQLDNILPSFTQKEQIIRNLVDKLSMFVASYNEDGLSLTLKPEEFENSTRLKLNINQAIKKVLKLSSRNF